MEDNFRLPQATGMVHSITMVAMRCTFWMHELGVPGLQQHKIQIRVSFKDLKARMRTPSTIGQGRKYEPARYLVLHAEQGYGKVYREFMLVRRAPAVSDASENPGRIRYGGLQNEVEKYVLPATGYKFE